MRTIEDLDPESYELTETFDKVYKTFIDYDQRLTWQLEVTTFKRVEIDERFTFKGREWIVTGKYRETTYPQRGLISEHLTLVGFDQNLAS